ncbi:serine/arginine repetitive matrix protein 1-like [Elysia marginata]|uniref:Serine/arginine repetitive matrix protein 1-like n=1 Tax=Elysia marginata TaxID=1093978 RepID=A0AAV4JPE8_9GAST|nr:serine/arginine repetitive matrix protein 1-like [Elysia marginata]
MSLLKKTLAGASKKRFVSLYAALKKKKTEDDGPVPAPWLPDRLAISSRPCRFELPMDFRDLETMSVREYLLKYCKIPRHRQTHYKRLFDRHKSRATGSLTIQFCCNGSSKSHSNCNRTSNSRSSSSSRRTTSTVAVVRVVVVEVVVLVEVVFKVVVELVVATLRAAA